MMNQNLELKIEQMEQYKLTIKEAVVLFSSLPRWEKYGKS